MSADDILTAICSYEEDALLNLLAQQCEFDPEDWKTARDDQTWPQFWFGMPQRCVLHRKAAALPPEKVELLRQLQQRSLHQLPSGAWAWNEDATNADKNRIRCLQMEAAGWTHQNEGWNALTEKEIGPHWTHTGEQTCEDPLGREIIQQSIMTLQRCAIIREALTNGDFADAVEGFGALHEHFVLASARISHQERLQESRRGRTKGRPTGSRMIDGSVFRAKYPLIYARLERENGRRPAQVDVAAELGVTLKTFARTRAAYGLPWPPM